MHIPTLSPTIENYHMTDTPHEEKTVIGGTETAMGFIRHLPTQVGNHHISAPVILRRNKSGLVLARMSSTNERLPVPLVHPNGDRYAYALPGGGHAWGPK